MLINWYPGHMHKAQKKAKEIMPSIDVVIEVLDSRLPYSSANPMIESIRGNKPYLIILSKSDLADPDHTREWLTHLNQQEHTFALAISTKEPHISRSIPKRLLDLFPDRNLKAKPIKCLIMGIPNVGKSTLINTLAGKKIAPVGNEPAITKAQQRIKIADGLFLIDSPGMTWPRSKNETINYRLATSGAIRDTAMSYDDVAMFAMEVMLERYPERLVQAYQIKELKNEAWEVLEQIAQKRGCMKGKNTDFLRVGELFIRELRQGKLGPITLENVGSDCDLIKVS